MSENSKIEWTDHTFNPWIGCTKVSDGCKNCYAEEMMDKRYKRAKWGVNGTRVVTSNHYWTEPVRWNKAAEKAGERHRVFCASLADVFEDRPELHAPRARLFDLIRQTPNLDWLLLTKRPENIIPAIESALILSQGGDPSDKNYFVEHDGDFPANELACWLNDWFDTPPANVWLGTSVENQAAADERIPHLLKVPAVVRFLSCEPLLGPVDLSRWLCDFELSRSSPYGNLHWAIAGCESGPNRRWFQLGHAQEIKEQCAAAGVAYFGKQMLIDGKVSHDMSEWPEDLRVREFPKVQVPA